MNWKEEYPTIADLNSAHIDTVIQWGINLPPPQTDVERAVKRRITKKVIAHTGKTHPEIEGQFNEIMDKLKSLGIDGRAL